MNLLHQRIGGHEGISKLLRRFYADVRQDPLIGPIFNEDQGLETSLGNLGRYTEALADFTQAIELNKPAKSIVLQDRATLYEKMGEKERAASDRASAGL